MADEIKVVITGKDGVSKTFVAVTDSAKKMEQAVTGEAKQTGTSLTKMSQDAEKASKATTKSFAEIRTSATRDFAVAGAAFGVAIKGFSNDITRNQQQLRNLDRFYGEAASGLRAYAQEIQSSTQFSSEQAIAVENIFGTLARNYGLQADQIKTLTRLSADYAASSGLGIEDVAMRLQAAIRGEGEAAEALGLTMNQQSIDRQGLTLTMSNQEAAQYRLNALMQQSSVVEGAAAERASTTAGKVAQLNNTFQDGARAVLSYTGPLPGLVTGITSVGLSSGASLAGIVAMTKGMREGAQAAGSYRNLLAGFVTSGAGTAAMLGGLAIATGVAFVAARELSRAIDGDFYRSLSKGNEVAADLDATISKLAGSLTDATVALHFAGISNGLDQVGTDLNRIKELQWDIANAQATRSPASSSAFLDEANNIQALQAELDALTAKYGDVDQATRTWRDAQTDLQSVLLHVSAGSDLAKQRALEVSDAYNAGQMSLADYAWNLNWITENYSYYDQAALTATASTQQFAQSIATLDTAISGILNSNLGDQYKQVAIDMQVATQSIMQSIGATGKLTQDEFGAFQKNLTTLTSYTGPAISYVQQSLNEYNRLLATGVITQEQYVQYVAALANALPTLTANAEKAAFAQTRLNDAMSAGEVAARRGSGGVTALSQTAGRASGPLTTLRDVVDANGETADRAGNSFHRLGDAIEHTSKIAELSLGTSRTVERSYDAWRGETETLVVAHDKLRDSLAGGTDEMEAYQQQLESTAKSIGMLTTAQQFAADGIKSPSLDVAVNLQMGQGGFDAVMGAINTAKSLSSNIGGAKSWADELIGDPGTWSELDKLLDEGRISQQQYTAAQKAQVSISKDVTNAQRDLLAVQTNLAPTLAEVTHQQAAYIDSLQDMDAKQQTVALGYLDATESAKALGLAQLAAASTTDAMQASTSAMIEQAAAADPVLKAMLEDIGLLNENGTVNFDSNADDMTKAIDALSGAVRDLTDVIADLPSSVTTDIYANDYASGTVDEVRRQLDSLDGTTATVYISPVTTGSIPSGSAIGGGRNGGIIGYARGGVVAAQLAEAGPELVGLKNGGLALVPNPGVYALPVGANVTTAPVTQRVLSDAASLNRGGIDLRGSTINLYPATADVERDLRSWLVSNARSA